MPPSSHERWKLFHDDWKTQQWPQDWKMSVFIPVPKKGNVKECSNYCTIALISHASKAIALISHTSKVILKILQARFQQYVNHELPDVQAGFRKGRGIRDQIANICWIIGKKREFQKTSTSALLITPNLWPCWSQETMKIPQGMGIPDHLNCLLRNLHASQEATVRTGHGTTDWFQIKKGIHQDCILSPWFFNIYTEYITQNAGLHGA